MTMLTASPAAFQESTAQKILLVEPHLMVADAMVSCMQDDLGVQFTVVDSVTAALAEIKKNGKFSLMLVDISSCSGIGRSQVEDLNRKNGLSTVALIADRESQNNIRGLFELDIRGVILKSMPVGTVSNIIRFMLCGEIFFPPLLTKASSKAKNGSDGNFTSCEHQVLILLEQGYSNRQIAKSICKSEATVKMHLTTLFRKLKAKNRTAAVVNARKLKVIWN